MRSTKKDTRGIEIECSNCREEVEKESVNESLSKFKMRLCKICFNKYQQVELEPSSNKELKGIEIRK